MALFPLSDYSGMRTTENPKSLPGSDFVEISPFQLIGLENIKATDSFLNVTAVESFMNDLFVLYIYENFV